MKDFPAFDLELLRRFMAVAQTRSLRRAATELGMSQPPLTRSIQQLEALVATPLLERGSRGVDLTPAGRVLMEQAPHLLAHAQRVFRATCSSPQVRRLNIGFAGLYGPLQKALVEFKARWPGCELRLRQLSTSEQYRGLQDGSLDIGFVFNFAEGQPGFDLELLDTLGVRLAVPESWAIARKASVSLPELSQLPFISASRETNSYRRDQLIARCRAAGFEPDIVHECRQVGDILRLVAMGLGISLIVMLSAGGQFKGVKYLPLNEDLSDLSSTLHMLWVAAKVTPVHQHFLDSVRASFAAGNRGEFAAGA